MASLSPTPLADVLVVYNPKASAADVGTIHRLLDKYFAGRQVDIVECSREDMAKRLAPWLRKGVKLIISAGGDGTISDIASGLPSDGPPVGILPLGTGNVLARELSVPVEVERSAALLAGDFAVRELDVLMVAGRAYLLAVGVGLAARALDETSVRRKKIFGKSSYLVSFFLNFFSMQPTTYKIRIDGKAISVRASDLMAANCGIIGYRSLRWWSEVQPDDGHMDLCFLEANTGFKYLWVIFNFLANRHMRRPWLDHIPMQESLIIEGPANLPVQGDGDLIGVTPVEIKLVPRALKVAVPEMEARG